MPYPTQVTRESILEATEALVEREGSDALSLAGLAQTLGIKPPSLYRYFPSKAALINALNLQTMAALAALQPQAAATGDPAAHALAIARNYRAYALQHPQRYAMALGTPATDPALQVALVTLALPIQDVIARVTSSDSLSALRGFMALVHGFVSLEQNSMFQRGGDLDTAFEQAIQAYLRGLAT
jgi:AcrR family transcriptional regulator